MVRCLSRNRRENKVCDTTAEALRDAEAVLIEVDMHQLEEKFSVDPWRCGPSLADMDLAGTPEAVKKRALG